MVTITYKGQVAFFSGQPVGEDKSPKTNSLTTKITSDHKVAFQSLTRVGVLTEVKEICGEISDDSKNRNTKESRR